MRWLLRGRVLQAAAGAGEGGGVGEMGVAQASRTAGVDPRFLQEVPRACTLFEHFLPHLNCWSSLSSVPPVRAA